MIKKKDNKIILNLNKKDLNQFFLMAILYEVLMDNIEGEEHVVSEAYRKIRNFYHSSDQEKTVNKVYDLLDRYVELEDMNLVEDLLTREKRSLQSLIETSKINFNDLEKNNMIDKLNESVSSSENVKLVIKKASRND